MKTIKELAQNKVHYATGYNDCKKDVLEVIDESANRSELDSISPKELKTRIEG